jgi:hypothetical protein
MLDSELKRPRLRRLWAELQRRLGKSMKVLLLELLLTGEAGKTLTRKQRQQARDFVQTLQSINKASSKIDPLSSVPNL